MDDETFKQRKERITLAIAIVAFCLSLASFVHDFLWQSSKLRITVLEVSEVPAEKDGVLAVSVAITNLGNRPATISKMAFFISIPNEVLNKYPDVVSDPLEYVDLQSVYKASPENDFFKLPFVIKPGEVVVKMIPAQYSLWSFKVPRNATLYLYAGFNMEVVGYTGERSHAQFDQATLQVRTTSEAIEMGGWGAPVKPFDVSP